MKYRLVRQTPLRNVLGGASLAAMGVLFVVADRIIFGAPLIVAGLVIGVPSTAGPVLALLFFLIIYAVILGTGYWANTFTGNDTRTFEEWAQDSVLFIILTAIGLITMLAIQFRLSRSGWKVLEEDFSEPGDWTQFDEDYPVQSGLLRIDEEIYAVTSIATERGVIVLNERKRCLLFQWDQIEKLVLAEGLRNCATIYIKRRTPLPLKVEVPWNREFSQYVPDCLSADAA